MDQTDKPADATGDKAPLLRIIPLGGLGEIGKNMMVLESGKNILIVDVGLMFPTNEMHGIDIVIPDAQYIYEHLDWVRGIVLTHGHEDHIGGLAYLMEQGLDAPIYATALTRGLLEVKLREHKLLGEVQLNTVTEDDVVDLEPFTVEFFHTCHSFPDSVGVSILTPAGRVIHTSDYRFDPTPVDDKPTESEKLRRWGDAGVLLLLADSTNVEKGGRTPSERTVGTMLEQVISRGSGACFADHFCQQPGTRPAGHRCCTAT